MKRLGNLAKQRELYILNRLYGRTRPLPLLPLYADDLRTDAFKALCPDEIAGFDFVRVTLLDLKSAGLVTLDDGWELTEKGRRIVNAFNVKGNTQLIYLASPYSTDHTAKQERWLDEVQQAVDYCFATQSHLYVFSPILYTVPIEKRGVTSVQDWVALDFYILECADELWVLMSEDWEQSKGVAKELDFAELHDIPIEFKTLDDILSLPDIPF